MKKHDIKNLFLLLSLVFMVTGCCSISLVSPTKDDVIVQHPKEMHEFLQLASAPRKDYFNDKDKRAVLYQRHQSVPTTFSWKSCCLLKDFNIEFALDENFTTNAQELVVSVDAAAKTAQVCNFQAGKTVYWRVTGKAPCGKIVTSPVGSFKTEDMLPRQITLPGVDMDFICFCIQAFMSSTPQALGKKSP